MKYTYFDRDEFVRQAADNEDIARQVAQLYHRDIAQDLSAMEEAFAARNMEAVRRLAHKSKSGFIIMGARELYQLALNIESRCKNGETDLQEDLKTFRTMCLGLDEEVVTAFKL
jgi:HPt (histidine-containing phosphotransfer) domain-containing protein